MAFSKRVFLAAAYNTTYFGSGRKEFHPKKPMPPYESYIQEAADGCVAQLDRADFDEGIIANFMAARYVKQGNLAGFLPMAVPSLKGKPCTRVEGACGSGGLALFSALRSVLSGLAESVFVLGFEQQNSMKAVYGADLLSLAGYHRDMRKSGFAHFFPGCFAARTGAYQKRYGEERTREGLAKWYELAILNARKNPKAQEYHNQLADPYASGLTPPNAKIFVPHINLYDCSKVTDGASALVMASEKGLNRLGLNLDDAVEIVGVGGSEGDITKKPRELTELDNTAIAAQKALDMAAISINDLAVMELHDCFSTSGLLSLEAIGFAKKGEGADFLLEGNTSIKGKIPTNLSGGLCGFGHPVGATGVRQACDLWEQLKQKAPHQAKLQSPYALLVNMGGDDVTVSSFVLKNI